MTRSVREAVGRLAPKGRFRSAVTVLLAGSVVGQLVVVASMPLLSRLYRPADLGLFAVFSSVESILVVAAALRYEYAIAASDDEDDAANLLGLALLLGAATSVVVVLGALLAAGPLRNVVDLGSLEPYAVLLGVSLAGDAAYRALSQWAIRRNEYASVARTKAVQGGVQATAQVGLGVAGLHPSGLLFGWTASRLAGTVRLGRVVHAHGAFGRISRSGMRDVAGRFRRFPALSAPASLLNGASLQLPGILLATAYDARAAGWYLLAARCTSIPMTVFGQSFSQAFMGRLSRAAVGPAVSTPRFVRRAVTRLLMFAAVPSIAIVVLAPVAFPVIFGADWREAGRYAQLLAPAALVQFAVSPVAWVLTLHDRQGWLLGWEVTRLGLVLVALLGPAALGAGPLAAIGGYSAVLVVTYLVLLAMVLRVESGGPAAPPVVEPVPGLVGTR
jgi:O-antigen/teichoic acid export membrane protein